MNYYEYIFTKKQLLDEVLIQYRTQPVGWGYIDTIVFRDEITNVINAISKIGFLIRGVSWWEYLKNSKEKAKIGMGGPISIFYPGWFAETQDNDELDQNIFSLLVNEYNINDVSNTNNDTLDLILRKKTKNYGSVNLCFQKDICLTPGLWIEVPDEWVNPFTDQISKQHLPIYQEMIEKNRICNLS